MLSSISSKNWFFVQLLLKKIYSHFSSSSSLSALDLDPEIVIGLLWKYRIIFEVSLFLIVSTYEGLLWISIISGFLFLFKFINFCKYFLLLLDNILELILIFLKFLDKYFFLFVLP